MRYRFVGCELDTDTYRLTVGGRVEPVEPQVFELLVHLIDHRERVVPKHELLDAVWGDRFVSESTLTSRIRTARQAVGDDGTAQRVIRTVHGRGHQFVAEVEVLDPGARADPPDSLSASTAPDGALPRPSTALVGREADVVTAIELLGHTRLLTLTGLGGVGKTRLAIEVARRIEARDAREARFVALTATSDAAEVPAIVADALGARGRRGSDDGAVMEALRGRSVLLVLDNFEHVIDAAPFVAELLTTGSDVVVLVTSRERLRVRGEQVHEVQPLELTGGTTTGWPAAMALFERVAASVDPAFAVTDDNADDVAAVCSALDGLPLAIELAAAATRLFSPADLLARISDRLDPPGAGLRDLPARHRTVRDAIGWSVDLLDQDERRLYRRLAVFAGPAPLAAIEQVCGSDLGSDAVTPLTGLVDKSLVHRSALAGGSPRFGMLELVREHAMEQLVASGEQPHLSERHARHVLDFLVDVEQRRWTSWSDRWVDLINERWPDIRAAHDWACRSGAPLLAAGIAAALHAYWHREGRRSHGMRWTLDALQSVDDLDPTLAGWLHLGAGHLAFAQRDRDAADDHYRAALAVFRRLDDHRYLALTLAFGALCRATVDAEDPAAASLLDESAALARVVADDPLSAYVENIHGELARFREDDDEANRYYASALAAARRAGDRRMQIIVLANLSSVAQHQGRYREAWELCQEALGSCSELGLRMVTAWVLAELGELAGAERGLGLPELSLRLIGASDAALAALGIPRRPGDEAETDRVIDRLVVELGRARVDELIAEGAAWSLEDAVAVARATAPPG